VGIQFSADEFQVLGGSLDVRRSELAVAGAGWVKH
jgi:hypothetical protein